MKRKLEQYDLVNDDDLIQESYHNSLTDQVRAFYKTMKVFHRSTPSTREFISFLNNLFMIRAYNDYYERAEIYAINLVYHHQYNPREYHSWFDIIPSELVDMLCKVLCNDEEFILLVS